MKVSGVGGSKGAGNVKKSKSANPDGAFSDQLRGVVDDGGETASAQGAAGAGVVTGMSAVLAAQDVGDATDGRSKGLMLQRGKFLLDMLDELRLDVLGGRVPKDKLICLAQNLREKRPHCEDEALNELIGDIEMRAEVELAKLTRQTT